MWEKNLPMHKLNISQCPLMLLFTETVEVIVNMPYPSQIHQPYIDIDQQHLDFRPRPSDCADFIWKPLDFAGFSESGRLYSFLSVLWAQLPL